MKIQYFLSISLLTLSLSMASCSSDSEPEKDKNIDIATDLSGTWISDLGSLWEYHSFSNGSYAYSDNTLGNWKSLNTERGNYRIANGNEVSCTYTYNGATVTRSFTVTDIKKLSFTALYDDGTTHTYSKLVSTVEVVPGEDSKLSFESGFPKVSGYASHNTAVATVDNSGMVTAKATGHTYVDVKTPEGTGVVEIIAFDRNNMFDDYSFAFGKTVAEIVNVKGTNYTYREPEKGIKYASDNYVVDEEQYLTGSVDMRHIESVTLILNKNIGTTELIKYLDAAYGQYSKTDNVYSYLTGEFVEGYPLYAKYDSSENSLTYTLAKMRDFWYDYTNLFGADEPTVSTVMKSYGHTYIFSDYNYSANGTDFYFVYDNNEVNMVGFSYNSENKVAQYIIYLATNYASFVADINTWLSQKYQFSAADSTKSVNVYYDSTKRIRVELDISEGFVTYTDLQQTPITTK